MSSVWDNAPAALKYELVEAFHDQERGAISFNDYMDRLIALVRPDNPGAVELLERVRRETAKAVLGRVCELTPDLTWDDVAEEFGVGS